MHMSNDVVVLAAELRWLQRAVERLEAQEPAASGAFYTRSEADAKFLTIADAADTYVDISAYGDFLLATGQAAGALIFPQIFSKGIYSYDGIWGSGAPNGDLVLEGTSDAAKTSSYVLIQPNGGKVGIGTAAPGAYLELSIPDDLRPGGTAARSNLFRFQGGQGGYIWGQRWNFDVMGYADLNSSRLVLAAGNNSTGSYTTSDVFSFTSTGALGIGVTAPAYALDVNGKANFRGDQLLFSGGSGLGADQADATATLYNRTSVGPTVSGAQFSIRTGTPTPAERLRINATGQTTLYGPSAATALRLENGGFSMNGSDALAIDAVGTAGGRFFVASDGKVGIGTASPTQKLDVNGVIKLRGDQLIFEGGSGLGADQGDSTATLYNRAGVGPTFSGYQVVFRTGATPAETMRIDASNNVGIGTAAPGARLHVSAGQLLMDNGYYYSAKNASATAVRLAGIDGSNNVYLGAIDNAGGKTIIREDGNDVISIHGGKVGIGYSTPANATLQVEGRVGIKTGVNAASAMLWVYQDDNGATIPVLRLTQADLSEEFIYFNATVGAGNPIDTAALGTYYGKVRVSVNGTFKFVPLYNS